MNNMLIEMFGLDFEETRLLFSLQYNLVLNDIKNTKGPLKGKKEEWLANWSKSILDLLEGHASGQTVNFIDDTNLVNMLKSLSSSQDLSKELIMLETILFTPYFPLLVEDKVKRYPLISTQKESYSNCINEYVVHFGGRIETIKRFRNANRKALNGVSKRIQKIVILGLASGVILAITAGYAAPAIGAMFSGPGIFGAAAASAGLAALGGGAIVAGGLGVAGGTLVVVGGGALFGIAGGSSVGAIVTMTSSLAISQSAKLEVVMKEILLDRQYDKALIIEILKEQRNSIRAYEDKLLEHETTLKEMMESSIANDKEVKEFKKAIKELKDVIKYMQIAQKRNENEVK